MLAKRTEFSNPEILTYPKKTNTHLPTINKAPRKRKHKTKKICHSNKIIYRSINPSPLSKPSSSTPHRKLKKP
jgi:hypothetical protein